MPLTGLHGPVDVVDDGSPPGNSCETEQFTSRYDLALQGGSAGEHETKCFRKGVEIVVTTHVTFTTLERVLSAYWYTEPMNACERVAHQKGGRGNGRTCVEH